MPEMFTNSIQTRYLEKIFGILFIETLLNVHPAVYFSYEKDSCTSSGK